MAAGRVSRETRADLRGAKGSETLSGDDKAILVDNLSAEALAKVEEQRLTKPVVDCTDSAQSGYEDFHTDR